MFCLLKDGKEVNAVMLVGRLFNARATVTNLVVNINGVLLRLHFLLAVCNLYVSLIHCLLSLILWMLYFG